jgi:hypothetical protein
MCSLVVHAPNVRHVRPSPTILDCLNYPGPPCKCVPGRYMHRMWHVRPSPTILDPQLSWPTFGVMCSLVVHAPNVRHVRPSPTILDCPQLSWPTFCKCVPWVVHAPNVRQTIPNYPGLSSTILAHLWCKCVPWDVHAPNVRHVRPSPTILDCPQLSWPTFGVNVFLGTCTETCEIPKPSWTVLNHPGPPLV